MGWRIPTIILAIVSLAPVWVFAAAPTPATPVSGAVVYSPHPHFRWEREPDVRIDEVHCIQIARDVAFAEVVCDDQLEVVSRFVPVKPLAPAKYWWRVRQGKGEWSDAIGFEVREPERLFTIPAGSSADAIVRVLQDAAEHCPARVNFEPGRYSLESQEGKSLVTLTKARDLILDGHGAKLVLAGTFLVLNDCQRVTIQNFTVTPARPGHTLVRVVSNAAADERLVVRPEPGYDTEVTRFFDMKDSGGSFLGCMDSRYHGKYLPGAGISARNVKISPGEAPGTFVFSPVKAATLELCPIDAVAVVTSYRRQWVQMNRTDQCTFSCITVTDLPGAFCGGSNNSAKSYLRCQVLPRTPQDYFGGHAATGSGRVGEWIEGCEFQCLPDDGPAEQSFRVPIVGSDGSEAVLLGGSVVSSPVRAGDRVALVNPKNGRGTSAAVQAVAQAGNAVRVQLDRPLATIAAAIRHDSRNPWTDVFIYRDSPGNEDFVYRNNRNMGGRAHGVKFNGTRAWIANNHFENLGGNAVLAGYTSEVSGHGARDVVVSGNTIVRCGWTPIDVTSTSRLGGNIIIRENRIAETREAGIYIKGCTGVSVAGNTFTSSTRPRQGAWIIVEQSEGIQTGGNVHPADTPEINNVSPRQ